MESQINAALYGQVASTLPQQDRMTNIRVRYPDAVRYDREQLERLPITLASAHACSASRRAASAAARRRFRQLGQVASIKVEPSANELWRENQQPMINVTAELESPKTWAT